MSLIAISIPNLSFKTATDGSTLVCTQQQLSDFRSEFSKKMNRNAVPVFKKRTGTPFRCVPVQFEPCMACLDAVKNDNKSLEKLQDFFFKTETRPKPRLSFLSSRRLETKTLVSRTTSLLILRDEEVRDVQEASEFRNTKCSVGGGNDAPRALGW